MSIFNMQNLKTYHPQLLVLLATTAYQQEFDFASELLVFFIRYLFLFEQFSNKNKSCDPKAPQFSAPQGNGEMGIRYLDPKYSRWLSTDPALGEYIPAAGKGNSENAGNLPGMGGIYNHINGDLYHYAGNNPVKYTDPDGKAATAGITLREALKLGLRKIAPKAGLATLDGPSPVLDVVLTIWFCYDMYKIYKNYQVSDDSAPDNSEAKPKEEPSPLPKYDSKNGHNGSIPDDPSVTGHIFDPKKEGHLPEDTPENRQKLNDVGNDERSYLGQDQYGNDWHGKINEDGSQTWTESRNGQIFDGGVNKYPKTFDPKTGLKSSDRPW